MRQNADKFRLSLAAAARRSPLLAPTFRATRARMLAGKHGTVEGRILSKLVKPGTVAIDVGANLGQYSAVMDRALCGKGFVLAFEPNPIAYEELVRGAQHKAIVPMQFALSSSVGTSRLRVPTTESGELQIQLGSLNHRADEGRGRDFEVEVQTLDNFLPMFQLPVSILKIDVEGFELEVLKGAEQTLEHHHPPIIVEIEHRHQPVGQRAEDVVQWLMYRGYHVSALTTSGLMDWEAALTKQATYQHGSDSPGEDYLNNFLCKAAGSER
jgi:FkbM family methyltransferase